MTRPRHRPRIARSIARSKRILADYRARGIAPTRDRDRNSVEAHAGAARSLGEYSLSTIPTGEWLRVTRDADDEAWRIERADLDVTDRDEIEDTLRKEVERIRAQNYDPTPFRGSQS